MRKIISRIASPDLKNETKLETGKKPNLVGLQQSQKILSKYMVNKI